MRDSKGRGSGGLEVGLTLGLGGEGEEGDWEGGKVLGRDLAKK